MNYEYFRNYRLNRPRGTCLSLAKEAGFEAHVNSCLGGTPRPDGYQTQALMSGQKKKTRWRYVATVEG